MRELPGFKVFFQRIDSYGKKIEHQQNTIIELSIEVQHIADRLNQIVIDMQTAIDEQSVKSNREVASLNRIVEGYATELMQARKKILCIDLR